MAKIDITRAGWTAPITFTERTLVQVKSGWPVLVVLVPPTDLEDGFVWEDKSIIIFEPQQTVQFRSKTTVTSTLYQGAFK